MYPFTGSGYSTATSDTVPIALRLIPYHRIASMGLRL